MVRAALRLLAAAAAVAFVCGAVAFAARFVVHGPVHASSLARSVTLGSPSEGPLFDDYGHCRRERRARTWRCSITDSGASGGVDYRVVVRPGSSCWNARLIAVYGEPMPDRLDGCVHLWQWSLSELL